MGRVGFVDRIGGLLAALIGSLIAWKCPYELNYWLSLISIAISFVITLTLVEPDIRSEEEKKEYKQYIKQAFEFLRTSPSVKFVVLYGIIIASCLTYVDEFWQIYLKEIKIPVLFFGVVSAGNSLIFSLGSVFIYRVKKSLSYKAIFTILLLLFSIGLLISSLINSVVGIIPLLLAFVSAGAVEPLVYGYLHHRADSAFRATAESFQSLALRLTIIVIGLFFGWFSTHYDIFIGFRLLGFAALIYFVYYLVFQFRYLEKE